MSVRKTAGPRGNGVHNEPAYMLHRYEWSESSLILELFTRNLGRVAVAAKGVRRPTSSFRSILLPFQPLLVSMGPEAEIRTLKGAEWAGGYAMPTGEALLIGYYLNELIMRLFARDDAQQNVFDAYAHTLAVIAQQEDEQLTQPMLRMFELVVLQALGVLPALNQEALTSNPLSGDGVLYTLDADIGLVRLDASETSSFRPDKRVGVPDGVWLHIHEAFESENRVEALPLAVAPAVQELKAILRIILNHHLGTDFLYARQLMQRLQKFKK
ncbi:MAG: DNA repair protein RecO [Saezia sp.]